MLREEIHLQNNMINDLSSKSRLDVSTSPQCGQVKTEFFAPEKDCDELLKRYSNLDSQALENEEQQVDRHRQLK